MSITPDEVLDFWFEGDPAVYRDKWFGKDPAFDQACARFVDPIRDAHHGGYDSWALTPGGSLALIILQDQLPRNVFRDQPESFAGDVRAVNVADTTVFCGFDSRLTPYQRMFVYLPFEHSESLRDQDRSVELFETLRADIGDDAVEYAYRHRDVIRRFGRFPHRNEILWRISTPEEEEYLAEPGSGF